jgi:hypothetical protein
MKEIPVPAISIYEFECNLDLVDRAFQDLRSQRIEWSKEPEERSSAGYINLENTIPWYHEELFNWMQDCINKVTEKTLKLPLVICDSWATKTNFKQNTTNHAHPHSVLSGLLYFTDHKDSSTLVEYNNHNQQKFVPLFFKGINVQGNLKFVPKKGKFIIFPSDLYHSVQVHTEIKNTRYTLAINTFFNGVISKNPSSVLEFNVVTVKDRYLTWKSQQNNKDSK